MQRVGTRGRVLYIRQHQTIPGMMATPKKLSLEQQDHSHKYKGVYLDLLRSILILPKIPTISCPINQRTVKSSSSLWKINHTSPNSACFHYTRPLYEPGRA